MRFRILLDPAPNDGGNGTSAAPAAPDYTAALSKYSGDANAMAMAQFGEANRLRSELEKARGELGEARKAIPPQGARILSADEAKKFDALAAFGEPADVERRLNEGKVAAEKVAANDRKALIADASKAHNLNPDVLAHLAGNDLPIELKEVTRNGKQAKAANVVVTTVDEAGKEQVERIPLDKYAEKTWPQFAASLVVKQPAAEYGTPSPNAYLAPYQPALSPAASSEPFVNIA